MKTHLLIITVICFLQIQTDHVIAHPTGNIVIINDHILWSYVYPVGDIAHHACIMIWNQKSEPRPFLVSEFPASDFILFSNGDHLYIIENRYVNSDKSFKTRFMKTRLNEQPKVIWPWFEDKQKIGTGGFFMKNDSQIVYAHFPNVYIKDKNEKEKIYFETSDKIKRLRLVENYKILLLSDNNCLLSNQSGSILKSWNNLPQDGIENAPLNRNTIFDADYRKGFLLFAYWGKRSFEIIDKNNQRIIIKQDKAEWVSHWVAFYNDIPLLFSSQMDFENPFNEDKTLSTIIPHFVMYDNNRIVEIWTK